MFSGAVDIRRPCLEPGRVEDTLYEVQFTLEPQTEGRRAVETILDAVLDDVRRAWPECPRLRRDEPLEHPPSRFGGFRFQSRTKPGTGWDGQLLWRAVHPVVSGAPITTRLLVEEHSGFVRVSVRVTADDGATSVGGFGAGHAQPPFFQALRRAGLTPSWLGAPLGARDVGPGMVEDLVHSTLGNPERNLTAVVLAPLEEEEGYVVPPDDLAWELLGRAHLWVLESHPQTYQLTDCVGDRRMSCFRGAARAYLPGWSRHDDPYRHPLLPGDRLSDPVMRATWLGALSVHYGTPLRFPDLEPDRTPVDVRTPAPAPAAEAHAAPQPSDRALLAREAVASDDPGPTEGAMADAPGSAPPEVRQPAPRFAQPDPSPALEELIDTVHSLHAAVSRLSDEVERLRTISAVRSSSTSAIERRLGRLEDILEAAFPDGTGSAASVAVDAGEDPEGPDEESRPSLVEVVKDVADSYGDAIAFLDAAYASAEDSPYEDPDRVRAILEAMGGIARRRRDGVLGMSLREAFADLGIDYRSAIARTTSARLREQYRFTFGNEPIETEEHIVLGNTYNPRRCLRIYFTSRLASDPRFVVAHVGRHFEVKSSS